MILSRRARRRRPADPAVDLHLCELVTFECRVHGLGAHLELHAAAQQELATSQRGRLGGTTHAPSQRRGQSTATAAPHPPPTDAMGAGEPPLCRQAVVMAPWANHSFSWQGAWRERGARTLREARFEIHATVRPHHVISHVLASRPHRRSSQLLASAPAARAALAPTALGARGLPDPRARDASADDAFAASDTTSPRREPPERFAAGEVRWSGAGSPSERPTLVKRA